MLPHTPDQPDERDAPDARPGPLRRAAVDAA
jgi:hypothetical protein